MTTAIFPWQLLENSPLKMIQFPWRFNMLIMILFAILIASDPLQWFTQAWKKGVLMLLSLGLIMGSEVNLIQQHPAEYNSYTAFDKLDSNSIGSGQEYLPKTASLATLIKTPHVPQVKNGSVQITAFKQNQSQLTFNFNHAHAAQVSVPVIAYYGYSAKKSTGDVSHLRMDRTNNDLGLLKLNGNGVVRINYYPTFVQKISKIISLISLLILVVFVFKIRKKE